MTPAQPRITVLMPTCNRPQFLPDAVASVLDQRLGNLELIVVDDGSDPPARETLAQVCDPRLTIVRQPNAGIAAALRTGLARARGEYIARNDDDDLWLPHMLETLVPELDRHPEAVVAYGRSREIGRDGDPRPGIRGFAQPFPDAPTLSLLRADYTSSIATLIRREALLEAGGYDPAIRWNDDYDLVLRLSRLGPFRFVNCTVAHYRVHEGNTTRLEGPRLQACMTERVEVVRRILDAPDMPLEIRRSRPIVMRNMFLNQGHCWLQERDLRRALAAYRTAMRQGGPRSRTLMRLGWTLFHWFVLGRSRTATSLAARLVNARRRRVYRHGEPVR